ncbi:hypothetical protein AVEN_149846-1 [Araneus ventricosus]|uniref:Uncharacterized protein n=1 Tax=Araneus ventricosus TaxID=182803 RepID=A0A4Y2E029_ARAVE|nr:hypothetical protein AVEN_149846-1 [Araneus ventricosus]
MRLKNHWVLEAPSKVFHNFKELRKIPINWVMYQLKKFLHIRRYSTCKAYGHAANSKECKFATPFVDVADSDATPETAKITNSTALTVLKGADFEALTTKFGTEP